MKNTKLMLLIIGFALSALQSISQVPKYYDSKGRLIVADVSKLSNDQKFDSTYIKSLPKTITLSNLTKSDLRVFKNLILKKVLDSDKPYDQQTRVVFDKIILDLQDKSNTISSYRIVSLPTSYLIDYSVNNSKKYEEFVSIRQDIRQFLRIAENVQKIDTAFYFLSHGFRQVINKQILRKDIKTKP